jgi:thymidylate synthase (FAD)
MEVRLVKDQDNDLKIVNAARVSFDKTSDWDSYTVNSQEGSDFGGVLSEGDQKLIKYLADHDHWTPFAHVRETFYLFDIEDILYSQDNTLRSGMAWDWYKNGFAVRHSLYGWSRIFSLLSSADQYTVSTGLHTFYPVGAKALGIPRLDKVVMETPDLSMYRPFRDFTVHVKAPIFVARQLAKHQVDLVWNEVSRRYVDYEPDFYFPDTWRKRAANVKQGSSEEEIEGDYYHSYSDRVHELSLRCYSDMLKDGVCPEQARMVLPQSMMTEWWWTGSRDAFDRVLLLRLDPHTQKETRTVAEMIQNEIS